jgi:cyclopropane-fatty-acyl-phospholipid synthase
MAISQSFAESSLRYRAAVESLLDGSEVAINGRRPWDIQVRDEIFFERVLAQGTLGVGESYMDGQWECERLDEMLFRPCGLSRSASIITTSATTSTSACSTHA